MIETEGIEKVNILHNENFWTLREHLGKIVFIGGGVISAELGQSLARLGCEVCIMDKNPRILKVTDEEIGKLSPEWNWLVGHYKEPVDGAPKLLHYTEGGPWFENYRDCEYNYEWKAELFNMMEDEV